MDRNCTTLIWYIPSASTVRISTWFPASRQRAASSSKVAISRAAEDRASRIANCRHFSTWRFVGTMEQTAAISSVQRFTEGVS